MTPKNLNRIVGRLVEVAFTTPVCDMEKEFRKTLMLALPFCFACGDFTIDQTICNKCTLKHFEKVQTELGIKNE